MQTIRVSRGATAQALPRSVESALPYRLSDEIRRTGYGSRIEEIRMRLGRRASLVVSGRNVMLDTTLSRTEIEAVLEGMCQGSLYAFSDTINQGYIALPDGVRVGVCGRAGCEGERIIGIYEISSLSVRIPHKSRPVGEEICLLIDEFQRTSGVLIYSAPGVGKTTLLRGVASGLASGDWRGDGTRIHDPLRTVVIDTRGELAFAGDGEDLCLDVLSGYPRRQGIEIATRCLNAEVIICDEIGDYEEAMSLVASHNCGVPLVASAHAASVEQLLSRTGLRLLHEAKIFGAYVGIRRDGRGGFFCDVTYRRDVCF
jgi:stage III sporulation protein AA